MRKLNDAVFDVLENQGMTVLNDTLFNAVAGAGANVEQSSHLVKFPAKMIEAIIEHQRSRSSQKTEVKQKPEFSPTWVACHKYLDWDKQTLRLATQEDQIEMFHLADAIPEIKRVEPAFVTQGMSPLMEPIEITALMLNHTKKPGGVSSSSIRQYKYLMELGEIVSGHTGDARFIDTMVCITSPLIFTKESGDFILERSRCGQKQCHIYPMSTSGGNAPVTVAGTVVQACAEILGGWMVVKALDPEISLGAGLATGIMDMKTMKTSFCSPEVILQKAGVYQMFQEYYGGHTYVGGRHLCDATAPGMQAAFEKTFSTCMLGATDMPTFNFLGVLDNSNIFSPLQAMIDLDMARGMWNVFKGIEVNEETLAVDAIREVRDKGVDSFLSCEHTLRNFKTALWMPTLFDRTNWKEFACDMNKDKELLDKANKAWKDIVKTYQPFELEKGKKLAIEAVLKSARKELL